MPNTKGGKKHKRGASKYSNNKTLVVKEEDEHEYAIIDKKLGNGRFTCKCLDEKERIAKICGTMRKKVWVNPGDVVLVSLREFEVKDNKCDIIAKYDN